MSRNPESMRGPVEFMHYIPVKRPYEGTPKDWKYSSLDIMVDSINPGNAIDCGM
jgi:hypothetical protein